jgi:phage terminase large subunit GpA-like protein
MTDEKKPPQRVAGVICAGVDVMSDRLEVGVYAFTPDAKRVAHLVLWGDPGQDACWQQLHALLCGLSGLQAVAVDSGGHHTQQVYRFAHASSQEGSGAAHKVFAAKNQSIRGVPSGTRTMQVDVCHRGQVLNGPIELLLINMETNTDSTDVYTLAQAVYTKETSTRSAMRAMDLKPPRA